LAAGDATRGFPFYNGARPTRPRRKRSWKRWLLLTALFVLSLQFGVFYAVIRKAHVTPVPRGDVQVVMVYTGEAGRIAAGMDLARALKPDWFFVSRTNLQEIRFRRLDRTLAPSRVAGDYDSRTTDSDARAAAAFLRGRGARRAVLVTSWYHLPRATLLTGWYLRGQGVQLRPVPAAPAPSGFLLRGEFWLEMGKGWGSLYRVVKHAIQGDPK
jgi:uncharacterized SAM-binding protein YcdF (DUF218 family)